MQLNGGPPPHAADGEERAAVRRGVERLALLPTGVVGRAQTSGTPVDSGSRVEASRHRLAPVSRRAFPIIN